MVCESTFSDQLARMWSDGTPFSESKLLTRKNEIQKRINEVLKKILRRDKLLTEFYCGLLRPAEKVILNL